MLNLKFNPETKTLLATEKDFAELIKSLGGTEYKFVPADSPDVFTGTITLPICIETKEITEIIDCGYKEIETEEFIKKCPMARAIFGTKEK